MKNLFFFIAAFLFVLAGCNKQDINELRNDLEKLEGRVANLEELCGQNNTNISSLQSIVNAINTGDYITGLAPVTKNGTQIGYTISFAKQSPITIFNGTNGNDGKDGKNGESPVISVEKAGDGIYYWTLNGTWLYDNEGQKLRVSGENGTNGVTPQLKIENNDWYVSYDLDTWTYLAKAKGDDGDSMFKKVIRDGNLVYFTLSDGSIIKLEGELTIKEHGAIRALFSIAKDKKVYFSMGNLQYQPSTKKWRFALNQYDKVGDNNKSISSDFYTGWIDLFGYGTSGWDNGSEEYLPTSYYNEPKDYCFYDLIGDYAKADWGVYNAISNGGNKVGLWRTLTAKEWYFLLQSRNNAKSLRGHATVNGIEGVIFLPDNWLAPSGVEAFVSGDIRNHNVYSLTEWDEMEKSGAVFLPGCGYREGIELCYDGLTFYWASAFIVSLDNYYEKVNVMYDGSSASFQLYRSNGCSVRLVQDVE